MALIQRVPVVQQVVDNIKEYITSGRAQIGEKLPSEAEWCENLGVGRGTVREAVRILEAKGFVELRSGRGAFVARTDEVDMGEVLDWFKENEIEMKDFLEVRSAIEPVAIKLAIGRSTPEDVKELKRIYEKTVAAVESNDVPEIAELDEAFHTFIVGCSRNKLLVSINSQMSEYLKAFRGKTFYIPSNAHNLLVPHGKILDAFVNGDGDAGAACMIEHLNWVKKDFQKSLDPSHEPAEE